MTRRRTSRPLSPTALASITAALASLAVGSSAFAQDGGDDLSGYDLDIPLVEYVWDPSAGDPEVPAELGGPGFSGEGWETNMRFQALGSAEAVRGGSITLSRPDWPATLRMAGKDWNTDLTYQIRDLCYESLLGMHPVTLEFIPKIATHWWISEDKMTYRFRLNPRARFSNGEPVTAQDFVASYDLRMDPSLLDPSSIMTFKKMEAPVALSKYMLEVKCKEENWRNFLYISGIALAVFPASQISIAGSEYLDKYQFKLTAASGPYSVKDDDIVMGQSVTVRRRNDWWDEGNPAWTGLYNIDTYKYIVIKDTNLEFEKFKKGEFDFYIIGRAQWWAEELPKVEAVKRGLIVRRKIYNDAPRGTQGMAINTLRPPLDDLRVRKALCHLYDRRLLIEKFMFNEYVPLKSHWPGGPYENPDNVAIEYDELAAVELLEEAGWTEIDSRGYRVKDGKELAFDLTFSSKAFERYLTVYQEACKRAGIRLELQEQTPASRWKSMRQKEYDLSNTAWGALVIANPETSWKGELADQVDNNNVTSFKDERVDELCEEYDREYDPKRRSEIVQEIDGLVFNAHPYVLAWYQPCERVCFWNKFSLPKWGAHRVVNDDYMHMEMWVDPEKEKLLARAKSDPSITMDPGPVDNRFWQAWNLAHRKGD